MSARAVLRVAAVALALTFVLVRTPDAHAASRTLAVSPPTGLIDQVVTVHWTGFHPTTSAGQYTVSVFQCKGKPRSLNDCFTLIRPPAGLDATGSGVQDAVTKRDGTGSVFLEVRPALQLPILDCTSKQPCSVIAFENDGELIPPGRLPATAVTAPIAFAKSPADCPQVRTPDVTTEGDASPSAALYGWSADLCTGSQALSVDYTELSGPAGRRDFLASNVDIGLTSRPASARELKGSSRASALAYAPIDVSGVVVAFNASDAVTGQRITDMNLTPRLVAILIAGQEFGGPGNYLFSDPEFLRLNPHHNWPYSTQPPLVRAERNDDAYILTNWLQQDKAARRFLDGKDPVAQVDDYWKGIAYPTDIFEARDPNTVGRYNPLTGTLANVRRLFNFQPPGDGVSISAGNDALFGIMDAVRARYFGLPTAKLRPANGTKFIADDAPGLTAGYKAMQTNPDGVTKAANPVAAGGYPLVKVDYGMVPTKGLTAQKAGHLGEFLDFVSSTGQDPGHLPSGYLPLPQDQRTQDATARELVQRGVLPPPPVTAPPTVQPSTDLGNTGLGSVPATSGSVGPSAGGATPASPGADSSTPDAGAQLASNARPASTNPVLQALHDFFGGDHHLLLPVIIALGGAALAAGPMLILRSQGKLRRPRRGSREAESSVA